MAADIGILLDVSGSMKNSIDDNGAEEEKWVESTITAIDDIIKHDVSRENSVFCIGFGTQEGVGKLDILTTIKNAEEPITDETIEDIFRIVEQNGASEVRKWAEKSVVKKEVTEHMGQMIVKELKSNEEFCFKFVNECLPSECRDVEPKKAFGVGVGVGLVGWGLSAVFPPAGILMGASALLMHPKINTKFYASAATTLVRKGTPAEVQEVVEKAKKHLPPSKYTIAVFSVQDASNILHVKDRDRSARRRRELLDIIEPYIYGGTPLYSAIKDTTTLFMDSARTHYNHKRLMFILSDGQPADGAYDFNRSLAQLRGAKVTTVGCYIAKYSDIKPRKLYDTSQRNWENGAKFLFDMSSTVPTEIVTRALFIKQGWEIDIDKNETRLFVHVSHPEHLKDACELARNVVCCQDVLCDLLATIDLDIYLNQQKECIHSVQQTSETCYAHAAATVLHLAMRRILGRDRYPEFKILCDRLIERYGRYGADTLAVLQEVCREYRLQCREVDLAGAMQAITEKRPVIARFRLTDNEWQTFDRFYRRYPRGILNQSHLDIQSRRGYGGTRGHAVVLTSYNSRYLHLMNSEGENWGDNGFFKVENAEVLNLKFIDVYWDLADLTWEERQMYERHGSTVATRLMKSLKGLQMATYTCPSCRKESMVTEFQGTLSHVNCPKCKAEFKCESADGNVLALNMHLTSLSAPESDESYF